MQISSEPAARRGVVFVASIAAAGVHLGAVRAHVDEWVPAAAFMFVCGIAQLAWGLAVARGAPREVLVAGAIVNGGVAALWFVSRTAGLPFGPEPGMAEHIHGTDALATALELIIVAAVFADPRPVLRLAYGGALAALVVAGDDPSRERLVAGATMIAAVAARALLAQLPHAVLVRLEWRNHAQVSIPDRLRPGSRAPADAGVGARG